MNLGSVALAGAMIAIGTISSALYTSFVPKSRPRLKNKDRNNSTTTEDNSTDAEEGSTTTDNSTTTTEEDGKKSERGIDT